MRFSTTGENGRKPSLIFKIELYNILLELVLLVEEQTDIIKIDFNHTVNELEIREYNET